MAYKDMGGINSQYAFEIQKRLALASNYYRWIFRKIEGFLGERILEIGCGSGHFTRLLAARDCFLMVADMDESYLLSVGTEHQRRDNFQVFKFDLSENLPSGLKEHQFDTIVCLNVLEHIKDDIQALRGLKEILMTSGRLILMVPAFPVLYGSMDQADNHYRRYCKKELLEKISLIGLSTIQCCYLNMPGFFAWFVNGRILRRKLLPTVQLGLYNKVMSLISHLEDIFTPPFGQSLIAVAINPI